jgi:hypothetical protein
MYYHFLVHAPKVTIINDVHQNIMDKYQATYFADLPFMFVILDILLKIN